MDGTAIAGQADLGRAGTDADASGFAVAGIADFDGDGRADILLRSAATGELLLWEMRAGLTHRALTVENPGPAWAVAAVGDYDGDGRADILWRSEETGEVYLWRMREDLMIGGTDYGNPGAEWEV